MHKIQNDLSKLVQDKVAASSRERPADAVKRMLLIADAVAVVPGVFIPLALIRPVASLVSSIKLITERAGTTTKVLYEIHERFAAHPHGGLNE